MKVSRGALLCETFLRRARARKGGLRRVGRSYLAHRLGCSTRTVSRYIRELRDAGRVEVEPPRRKLTRAGWRTCEVNGYRIQATTRHSCSSHRDDTRVTPPPNGGRETAHLRAVPAPLPDELPPIPEPIGRKGNYRAGLAAARAAMRSVVAAA